MGLYVSLRDSLCQTILEASHLTGRFSWKETFPLNIFVSTILQYCSYMGPVDPMYVKDPRNTNIRVLSKTPRMSPISHSCGRRWLRTHLGKRSDWELMWTLKLLPYHVISYPFYFVQKKSFHLRDRMGGLSQSYLKRNFLSSITLNLCLKKVEPCL